jgi:gliding motility-associated-like protein
MIKKSTRYLTLLVLFISICFCADAGNLKPGRGNKTGRKALISNPPPGQITGFSLPGQIGSESIDQAGHSIIILMHTGSPVTGLVPTITATAGSTVTPNPNIPRDFSSPVIYKVDGISYTVNLYYTRIAPAICAGTSTTTSGDPSTPPGTLGWEMLDVTNNTWGIIPGTNSPNYSTGILSSNPNTPKLYTFRRSITTAFGTAYDSYTDLTVNPNTQIAGNTINQPSPANSTFCVSGNPGTITGITPTGGIGTYTYQWQSSAGGGAFTDILGATAADLPPATVTATTIYQRIVFSGTCTPSTTSNPVTITVQNPLANNILTAPIPSAFCGSGTPGAITGSTPTGGDSHNYTYQWESSTDNTIFNPITINGSGKDYTPPSLSVTRYYHRIVIKSGTCSAPLVSGSVEIHITPPLTVNEISSPLITTFCISVDPAVIPTGFPGGGDGPGSYKYQWQSLLDGGTWTDIPGANSVDYDSPKITLTTSFRRTVTSGACMVPYPSNVVKFTIIPSPPNIAINPMTPICSGSTATLSVTAPDASLTYNWYDSATRDNLLFQGPVYETKPLAAGQTFYAEASNGTCTSPILASATVTVNPLPVAPTLVTNPVSTCQGSTAVLNILNPQPEYTYNWYTTATGGVPIFTGSRFPTPLINSNVTYYAEAVSGSGCVSSTRTSVPVSALPLPTVKAQGASVCPGETSTLTTDNSDVDVTINWYTTPTGGIPVYTGDSFTTLPISTNVTYYAEASNNNCVSATRSIAKVQVIQPLPTPVVSVEAAVAPSITFRWATVLEATGYLVSIDGGQTFTDPSSGSNGTTHTVTGLQIGQSVTIIVQATGGFSCQLSKNSTPVTGTTTNPLTDNIFVANAFTPNGDGKNDVVYVHNENIKSLKFYVYDQWGELLYVSQSQQNGWDGTFKGKTEPAGVYVYYLEANMNDGKQVKKKGTITLLR